MDLVHFSAAPLGALRNIKQPREAARQDKPLGLWVSDEGAGDGWHSWASGENFALDRLTVATRIILHQSARVLCIKSAEELRSFDHEFAAPPSRPYGRSGPAWWRVAEQWQGIMITPYQWSCQFDPDWYYGWDCASGCIWDISAIQRLEPVDPNAFKSEAA